MTVKPAVPFEERAAWVAKFPPIRYVDKVLMVRCEALVRAPGGIYHPDDPHLKARSGLQRSTDPADYRCKNWARWFVTPRKKWWQQKKFFRTTYQDYAYCWAHLWSNGLGEMTARDDWEKWVEQNPPPWAGS